MKILVRARALAARVRARIIPDWRRAWRFWSLRLAAIAGVLELIPAEIFLQLYALVPPDLQLLLPARRTIVILLFVTAFASRFIDQRLGGKETGSAAKS